MYREAEKNDRRGGKKKKNQEKRVAQKLTEENLQEWRSVESDDI